MVSMKDIALRCGVSVATVSKALNGQPDIGEETRSRIIAAAQEMGDRLCAAGVKGIWNFTNYEIAYDPGKVVVESVHFSDSLLALSYMISAPRAEDGEEEAE